MTASGGIRITLLSSEPRPSGYRRGRGARLSRAAFRSPPETQLLSGWLHSEGSGNFDANATGHVWGTFRLELDSGGVWIGSWVVDRTKVDGVNTWVGRGKFVGRGISGDVHGMHVRFSEVLTSFMPLPLADVGSIDARVLVPPPPQ